METLSPIKDECSFDEFDKPLCENSVKVNPVSDSWRASCSNTESTLHQLSPYIGKLKSVIARDLISTYTKQGDIVVDPFAGSGTVLLEAKLQGRRAFGSDISSYAALLSSAKTRAPKTLDVALKQAEKLLRLSNNLPPPDLRQVPPWVRKFFHPETLKKCINFTEICKMNRNTEFILSCFLGILHHQRPGFLSYPSSHLVPYLRDKKYPKNDFPEMYEYREIKPRLLAKIKRAYKRVPEFDHKIAVQFKHSSIEDISLPRKFQCLITSPPYMNALDYGRDNRLRLWFLERGGAEKIDAAQSQKKDGFSNTIEILAKKIEKSLEANGTAIFIIGEAVSRSYTAKITDVMKNIMLEHAPTLVLESVLVDTIPNIRRSRRELSGIQNEHFLIYRKRS